MNRIKNIAFSTLLAVGTFSAVTYTSCTKDECKDVVCSNGGTCVGGSCSCPAGYEGTTCQTKSRDRFLTSGTTATFKVGVGQDGCYSPGYNMTIAPGSNNDEIIISNFAGYGTSATVSGIKVNGLAFTYTGTTTAGAVTLSNISGTITQDGTSITYTYRAVDATKSINCNATATKQ